jgi:tetrahydrodipicolinate N-succinyltransferase
MKTVLDRQELKNKLYKKLVMLEDRVLEEDSEKAKQWHELLSDVVLTLSDLESQFEYRGGKIYILQEQKRVLTEENNKLTEENEKLKKMERFNR